MMNKAFQDALEATRMIPVFYNGDIEVAKNVLKACYDGGVRVFEFTNRGDKAAEVFPELKRFADTLDGLVLGVGSISFARDARRFIKMGAKFVVGPQYVPAVNRVCRCRKMPYVPGCGTVSEVGRAQRAGCSICKAFPGEVLGPSFVKSLLAPMPWSKIMVTGGVEPSKENLEAWFKAGACCVGMGSKLFPKDVIAVGDWASISARCRESLEIIASL